MTCATCRWAEIAVCCDGPMTECRRNPPQLVALDGDLFVAWPQMASADWCGEYTPRLQPQPEGAAAAESRLRGWWRTRRLSRLHARWGYPARKMAAILRDAKGGDDGEAT